MKTKYVLLWSAMLLFALTTTAQNQNANNTPPTSRSIIPYGKKLPPPEFSNYKSSTLQRVANRHENILPLPISASNAKEIKKIRNILSNFYWKEEMRKHRLITITHQRLHQTLAVITRMQIFILQKTLIHLPKVIPATFQKQ